MNSLAVLFTCLAAVSATGYAGMYSGGYWPGAAQGWSPYRATGHNNWDGHGWAGNGWDGQRYAGHGWAGYNPENDNAHTVVLPSGFLAETPAVAGARQAHLLAHAQTVVLPSGYLADTPSVAAAKRAHLTAHAHAVVHPSGYLADSPAVAAAKSAHLTAVDNIAHRDYVHGYAHGYNYARGWGHY